MSLPSMQQQLLPSIINTIAHDHEIQVDQETTKYNMTNVMYVM